MDQVYADHVNKMLLFLLGNTSAIFLEDKIFWKTKIL